MLSQTPARTVSQQESALIFGTEHEYQAAEASKDHLFENHCG
jgi:hypothetical protein